MYEHYSDVFSLKRTREDDDDERKDEDPTAGSDRGRKRQRSGKEPSTSKESPKKSTQKGGSSGSKHKSSGKSHADKPSDQENEPHDFTSGVADEQPVEEPVDKTAWFKTHLPLTPDHDWTDRRTAISGTDTTQHWLVDIAKQKQVKEFDQLMSTPIDFSAFLMHGLKIDYLDQATLVGPAFKLLKGTCSNYAELEFHFEEVFKAVNEKLDWNNPDGHPYPFDLREPLPVTHDNIGRPAIPVDYFINNDLAYLQGGEACRRLTTSLAKCKAAQYDNLKGIEDMVPSLWIATKVGYNLDVM